MMKKHRGWMIGWAAVGCLLPACVERRMTVVSDPPGAMLSVNGQEIGPTPVDVPSDKYIYHGKYHFLLKKDGYEPLFVEQAVPAKWYQYPGIDFFSEHIVPSSIKDRRTFAYQLMPSRIVPTEELLRNAEAVRQQGHAIGPPLTPVHKPPVESLPPPSPNARLGGPQPE